MLPLLRKHSPDGATRARLRTSDYSSLLIYRPRKDESLSWPKVLKMSRSERFIVAYSADGQR